MLFWMNWKILFEWCLLTATKIYFTLCLDKWKEDAYIQHIYIYKARFSQRKEPNEKKKNWRTQTLKNSVCWPNMGWCFFSFFFLFGLFFICYSQLVLLTFSFSFLSFENRSKSYCWTYSWTVSKSTILWKAL